MYTMNEKMKMKTKQSNEDNNQKKTSIQLSMLNYGIQFIFNMVMDNFD